MPSVKEIYHKIDDVRIEADSINLNVDGVEALLGTAQADLALIKTDVDDIRVDVANGVSVSGTVTATQATASNLKAQAQILDSSGNQLTYAATGTAGTPASDVISVQGISGGTPLPIRPRNGAVTVTTGTTSASANTSAQALASNSSRQYLLIQNISDTDMYFNFGAAATTSNLFVAKSGSGIVFESGFVPTDAVNVICASASKAYYILSA